jgi:hypothetical protein
MIFKIFSPIFSAKKFLTPNAAEFCKKWIVTSVFKNYANLFAKMVGSIDPRQD